VLYFVLYKYQISKIKINENINTIVCGDSHTQSAINDKKLNHTLNISQNSEPYLATYNVIRTITKNNPQIKNIIVGYSFHSLSNAFDEVIFKEKHKVDFYARYTPILDLESISAIAKHNFTGLIKSFPKSLNTWVTLRNITKMNKIDFNNYKFFGEYYPSKKSNCTHKTISNSIRRHYFNGKKEREFSLIQEEYLIKIVNYCYKHKKKLILINTPININYFNKVPKKFIIKYYKIASKFGDSVKLLDFHNLSLKPYQYGDGDHVNEFGAKILVIKIDSLINKNKI
jgi:hypothetical protein